MATRTRSVVIVRDTTRQVLLARKFSVSGRTLPAASSVRLSLPDNAQRRTMASDAAPKSALYTRTGDQGMTSLYDGTRVSKESDTVSVLGTIDELNAHLGLAAFYSEKANNPSLAEFIAGIQTRCLDMGSAVATPRAKDDESSRKHLITSFGPEHVAALEAKIDALDEKLPRLTNFILPSGGLASCQLHICRVVTRRAEREVWPLIQDGRVEEDVGRYLNRLSDFFFAAARTAAAHEGVTETVYIVSKHKIKENS